MSVQKNIFIIEDNNNTRENLEDLFSILNHPVQSFESSEDFLKKYQGESGVLVLDVRLPGQSGIQLFKNLQSNARDKKALQTIFLSAHGDIEMAVDCMKLGACDFVTKPFKNQTLIDVVHSTLKKDPSIGRDLSASIDEKFPDLSPREKEILEELRGGLTSKEIANKLSISIHTVEVHRANLIRKTDSKSIAQLLAKLNQ
ncbi:MAG: DNA-binding response regulator [Gammaproteobacteria bacterium]|nr:DNA-binding response regulator [Gammaproteobacteria bacterium]